MFKTVGNTWQLAQALLPGIEGPKAPSLVAMYVAPRLIRACPGGLAGTRVSRNFDSSPGTQENGLGATEYVPFAALYFAATFIIVYFNSALVSAAYEKLRVERQPSAALSESRTSTFRASSAGPAFRRRSAWFSSRFVAATALSPRFSPGCSLRFGVT